MNEFSILLERLSALQRNLMRKFAVEHGLQTVHVEILSYLGRCNRYSDTTQALTEYLGQTKGSISQSLAVLEEKLLVRRAQDESDRRIFHLHLSTKAKRLMEDYDSNYTVEPAKSLDAKGLLAALRDTQAKHGFRGFGICSSCKYCEHPGREQFVCGLTKETLTKEETVKQCREHETA